MFKKIFFLITVFLFSVDGFSQIPEIKVSVDTNNVLIGDQIKLLLQVNNRTKTNIIWPVVGDTLGHFEVVSRNKLDTLSKENRFTLKQTIVITCFDEGTYAIPSFTFGVVNDRDSVDTLITELLYLKFNTVEVDTTLDIKDIKGPLDVPIDWTEYIIYFIILLVVLALAFLGYKYWKKRKQKLPDLGYDPSIPPYVLALEALKQLESEKLWQGGYVKKYYIRLTDIIRIYIERQFKIKAMEMVTPEIISSLRNYGFEENLIIDMTELFTLADFVKFAKHQTLPDENSKCMNYSVNFVNVSSQMQSEEESVPELTTLNSQLSTNEQTGEAK
ncbi:MAG: BatD family protein [bacterium]